MNEGWQCRAGVAWRPFTGEAAAARPGSSRRG